jgi:hypothetical protein
LVHYNQSNKKKQLFRTNNFPEPKVGEFWTSKQRQGSSLHEISYRACFKPQLPHFFITRFSKRGDLVYDPFMGRGTTIVEAALLSRRAAGNDINPLSRILTEPRLNIPTLEEIENRLASIPLIKRAKAEIDLSMFYHPETEKEIVSLRHYLLSRRKYRRDDHIDRWIQMIATNRLTGHSVGFFSVYSLPPNQAAGQEAQRKINIKRNQHPSYRDTKKIILKKSRSLIRTVTSTEQKRLFSIGRKTAFFNADARMTSFIPSRSVQLTVTSPPFLDIVQYDSDNWLRNWFNGIESPPLITMARTIDRWAEFMEGVFQELYRITRLRGYVAFEVGEVRKGTIQLEDFVIPAGIKAGFSLVNLYLNVQKFTKTSNIWGITNNRGGTNTNRIVLFCKKENTKGT